MNGEIASALYGYIETLYRANKRLIKLYGVDAVESLGSRDIFELLQDIPRLIPFSFRKDIQKMELNPNNGLLEYNDKLVYLHPEYLKILNDNYDCLDKVRKIRNKYEHRIQAVRIISRYSSNTNGFQFGFEVIDEELYIEAKELIKVLKQLNILFQKILVDLVNFANKNKIDHPYFLKLKRIDFTRFNKIYESNILYEIGKTMNDL